MRITIPLRFRRAFDGIAGDLALVYGRGIRAVSSSRSVGDRKRDVVPLELRVFDRPFEDLHLAVDLASAIDGARQLSALQLEL